MQENEEENQEPTAIHLMREHVKTWLKLEDEIKTLRDEIKKRRNLKKKMTNELLKTFNDNDIDVMNAGDARLVRTKHKVRAPLSKKHLITSLLDFYKNDEVMVKTISQHILDTREVKIVENIKKKSK